jgi:hypothetical protein
MDISVNTRPEQIQLLRDPRVVWVASYPRSGNTLLRLILRQCFDLPSASLYPDDFGRVEALEECVGHLEYGSAGMQQWLDGASQLLVKTHEPPSSDRPAIYVVRDGRAACASLWEFYRRQHSLDVIVSGAHAFGTWAQHVAAWRPWERRHTLMLRYEDLVGNLPKVLEQVSGFLGAPIVRHRLPDREELAARTGGRWVRQQESHWRSVFTEQQYELFVYFNGEMMRFLNYEVPATLAASA